MLLLVISIYSYYCLSSRMTDYEKKRLEFILNKEKELELLEKKIKQIAFCTEKNEKYQQAISDINTIIDKLNLPPGSVCKNYNPVHKKQQIDEHKYVNHEHKYIHDEHKYVHREYNPKYIHDENKKL